MVESYRPEDIAAYNEQSLNALDRAIALSRGEFSLVLVRCNYKRLRDRLLRQLRKRSNNHYNIQEIVLPESVTTLYTTIQSLRQGVSCPTHEPYPALFILDLESVVALEDLLTSSNQVRDEFRKRLPCPLVLWMNDEVLQKFVKFAPDFASWAATPIKFEIGTDELIDFLQQKANSLFNTVLSAGSGRYAPWRVCLHQYSLNLADGCRSRLEIDSALKDLQSRQQIIKPELDASLQFVFGQYDYANDYIDSALVRYQKSLRFWRASNQLDRQGAVLFYIGLCYCRNADLHRSQRERHWEEAWPYLLQCIDVFEQAGRQDLVARFITQLVEVLERLKAWDTLQIWGQRAVILHKTFGSKLQLAQDYGFLAEVALQQSRWEQARAFAQQALSILAHIESKPIQHQGLHRFLLAQLYQLFLVKSQRALGQLEEAVHQLERASQELPSAIELSDHRYEPQRYLHLLEELRTLYFEEGRYLEAFRLKQEQRATEQLYGLRAFIGAARLQPQRLITNPTLTPIEQDEMVAQEIAASGREQDVNRLIERMTRADRKVTVIHGPSGVGKSSIVYAGLVPALKNRTLGDRIALPVALQVYTDWVRELGNSLAQALENFGGSEGEELIDASFNEIPNHQDKIPKILDQLRLNAKRNLLTVLTFDQFEEFFSVSTNPSHRRQFYDFLKNALNLEFVKVIFSIRQDYLHELLEIEQFNLEVIDNDILTKNIRYRLGNFSLEDARSVIEKLTNRAHFYLETALLDALVQDLAGELGTVRPIELQVVGAQLQAENITTLAQYQKLGPKQRLVERFLEKAITDCGPENENSAWLVLSLLTDENKNRPLKTRAELGVESGIESQKLDLILEILEKSGLVFLLPEVPANRYQLVHDYLVDFIRMKDELNIQQELQELRQKDKQSQDEIEQLRAELTEKELLVRQKELLAKLAQATAQQRSTEEKLNQVLEQRLRNAKLLGATFFLFALIAGVFGLRAAIGETNARLSDLSASSEALVTSNKQFEALLKSLRVGKQLKQSLGATPDTQMRVVTALQQAVYGVREYNRLEKHTDWVSSVSFSPDGKTIASASKDNTIKFWKADGTLLKNLGRSAGGHIAGVYSVSFSPNSKMIASASEDKTVKLWSSDGVLLHTLIGHSNSVSGVSFSPDRQTVASGSWDNTVKIWGVNGVLKRTLTGHTDKVWGVSFSPDGQTLASASADGTVRLWDSSDGKQLQILKAHNQPVTSVSFSPDGLLLATASWDNTVKLWGSDKQRGFQTIAYKTLQGHNSQVLNVSFSPNGQMIASASRDNTVKLWRRDGTLIDTLIGHGNLVQGVSFSPDSQTIASASADNTVKLWQRDKPPLTVFKGHTGPVNSVSFSPDGKAVSKAMPEGLIATASEDKTVRLWSSDGRVLHTLKGHENAVNAVSFSPKEQTLATASDDKTVKLWSFDGRVLHTLIGHVAPVISVVFSRDGQMIASASEDKTVKLWSRHGDLKHTLAGHTSRVYGVSISPDGKTIASGSEDKTVKLWSRDGTLIKTLTGHNDAVNWVSFSPDGQMIASASGDGTVKLWRSRDGVLQHTLKGHNSSVYWVSFSPDGQTLASASKDKTVKLWSLDSNLIATLQGHSDAVFGVSFSPDGKVLASASKDQTVILWNLNLDALLVRGCGWLHNYLKNNSEGRHVNRATLKDFRPLCNY